MPNTTAGTHRPIPEPVAATLAAALRELRTGRGITQENLASKAQVSVQMVRRLEAGTANPTLGTLHAVTEEDDEGLLPPVVTCDADRDHSWTPWQWHALGRQIASA